MTKTEAARIAREARRAAEAAREKAQFDRDIAAFYASGGHTKERRERFAPIWEEVCRKKAEREAATAARLPVTPEQGAAEPAAA